LVGWLMPVIATLNCSQFGTRTYEMLPAGLG
jgi:hypothetical protein